ncbi:filamentous hemagglutinin N-terminal domain-containing protein, partial [Campylobacter peloridis]
MHINGNKVNSIIQWGGGFNINKGESVKFGGNSKNYLNIAHGTNKSTIAGLLNANGKNVFLINPNGVIIEKSGTINANRFVASTSSMSNADMWKFASMKTFNDGLAFSPVFKPQKAGSVVNMGNINAKNVTLQGNKVVLNANTDYDKTLGNQTGIIKANNIKLEGNEVYVDVGNIYGNNIQNININAKNKGLVYLNASGYYYNPSSFKAFSKITANDKVSQNKYVGIGSVQDWWYFAKGWNEKEDFRTIASEYKLINTINFAGQNYANFWIDLNGDGKKQANEFTSMIVGNTKDNAFTKNFDGQGFVLKGMYIDTASLANNDSKKHYVGIFGATKEASFTNINVDYSGGGINAKNEYVGGFAGYLDGFVDKASLKNLTSLKNDVKVIVDSGYITTYGTGGFAGDANGMFRNITLENIKNFDVKVDFDFNLPPDTYWGTEWIYGVGGFAGSVFGLVDGISLKNMGNFTFKTNRGDDYELFTNLGGFAGYVANGHFSNISLNNIKNLKVETYNAISNLGGFAGRIDGGNFENISLKSIYDLTYHAKGNEYFYTSPSVGGFAGLISNGFYDKISLDDIKNLNFQIYGISGYLGGFAGIIDIGDFKNIFLNNINNIEVEVISKNYGANYYLGGFVGKIGKSYLAATNSPKFNNIHLQDINTIKLHANSGTDYSIRIGGFAGMVDSGKYENIYLDNINNLNTNAEGGWIWSERVFIGGFAGEIGVIYRDSPNLYKNIYLNNITNLKASGSSVNIGGFAGAISYGENSGKFENIILKNIQNIESKDSSIAGFVVTYGYHSIATHCYGYGVNFNNIFLDGIKNMSITANKEGAHGATIYGFAPLNSHSKFNNIYVYFHPSSIFKNNTGGGIYKFGPIGNDISKYSNIHIYHHENDFKDIMSNMNIKDKITTHIYNDSNKDEVYQEFKSKYELVKPNIQKPTITNPELSQSISKPSLPNITSIINEKPTLSKDDLISNAVWNDYIIKDIDKIKYTINIRLLDKLLKEYKTLANKTEDEQVK